MVRVGWKGYEGEAGPEQCSQKCPEVGADRVRVAVDEAARTDGRSGTAWYRLQQRPRPEDTGPQRCTGGLMTRAPTRSWPGDGQGLADPAPDV